MSKTANKMQCLLCGGNHIHTVYKSCKLLLHPIINGCTILGKFHPKMENVMSIMADPTSLKIDSLNIQLLRLMAVCFVYDNSDNATTFLYKNKKRSSNFDRLLQYNPIPLTLSKTRLKKELNKKWLKIHALKRKREAGPPNLLPEHACPICMEEMGSYTWFHYEYRFETKLETLDEPRDNNPRTINSYNYTFGINPVKTSCGHIMCSTCCGRMMNNYINFRTMSDYNYNICNGSIRKRLYGMYNLSCPLCRTNCIIEKRLGVDRDGFWGKRDKKNWWKLIRPKTTKRTVDGAVQWCDEP